MRGLFEQSALAKTALDALKLQHQQQRHHQVIDVAAIGSCPKLEDQRQQAAEKEAAARRVTDVQVLEDTERLIAAWNVRQAKRMPMLPPTIAAGGISASIAGAR